MVARRKHQQAKGIVKSSLCRIMRIQVVRQEKAETITLILEAREVQEV